MWGEFFREDMIGRFVLQLIMQFSHCDGYLRVIFSAKFWAAPPNKTKEKKSPCCISNSLFMAGHFQWWTKLPLKQMSKSEQNMTGYRHTSIIYKWQWCLSNSHQKNIRVSSNAFEAKSQFMVHDVFMKDSWFVSWFQNNHSFKIQSFSLLPASSSHSLLQHTRMIRTVSSTKEFI